MKAESFVYWLQGFFEISGTKKLNERQIEIIKNHLNMVFVHDIDPKLGNAEHQAKLNAAHVGHELDEDSDESEDYDSRSGSRSIDWNQTLYKC